MSLKCFRVRGERTESVFTFVFALTPEDRARLAECGPGIERLRDLQQAYAGGGDYMRQLLEALEVKLPTKEPS